MTAPSTRVIVAGAAGTLLIPIVSAPWVVKEAEAVLDYTLDATARVTDPVSHAVDAIASATVAVCPAGELTISSVSLASNKITVWLQGGLAGRMYSLRFEWTTTGSRVDAQPVGVLIDPALASFPLPAPANPGYGTPLSAT